MNGKWISNQNILSPWHWRTHREEAKEKAQTVHPLLEMQTTCSFIRVRPPVVLLLLLFSSARVKVIKWFQTWKRQNIYQLKTWWTKLENAVLAADLPMPAFVGHASGHCRHQTPSKQTSHHPSSRKNQIATTRNSTYFVRERDRAHAETVSFKNNHFKIACWRKYNIIIP